MIRYLFKILLIAFGVICFMLACQEQVSRQDLTDIDDMFRDRDTGLVMPQAIRVIPGISWASWILGDSIITNGFALMSQDTSNSKERIITDEAMISWLVSVLPDSFNLTSYADTLTIDARGDTITITGGNYVAIPHRIYGVDSLPEIYSKSFPLGATIMNRSNQATYKVQASAVSGYTTDSIGVIPTGGNYAVLEPAHGVYRAVWFGCTGDSTLDVTQPLTKAFSFVGLRGGKLDFDPGIHIATEIDFSIKKSLTVQGNGATIRRKDNYLSGDFQRMLDITMSTDGINFSMRNITLDANSRGNDEPEDQLGGINDWEHSATLFINVASGVDVNSITFEDMVLYDKAVYDHLAVYVGANDRVRFVTFRNIDAYSTHPNSIGRADFIWYQGTDRVVVDNCSIEVIDMEYTGSPSRKQFFEIRNTDLEILELSGNANSDTDSIFTMLQNVQVDSATSFSYVQVNADNCVFHTAIPVRLGNAQFIDCDLYVRNADGWNMGSVPTVNIDQYYLRTRFFLENGTPQTSGYHAIVFPQVLTANTLRRNYVFEKCEFLDTFWYITLLRANVTFDECKFQSQSTGIRATGLSGETINAKLIGGDFSKISGVPVVFTNWTQSTNIVSFDGIVSGNDARVAISGSVTDAYIKSNRVTVHSSLPTSAPYGDRARLTNFTTNGVSEYICTLTANGANWLLDKQIYLSGTTASRPSLTTKEKGYIYVDTDFGQPIIWDGSAWITITAYTSSGILVGTATSGPRLRSGSGSPEGVVTAPVGSMFLRTDGGASTTLYIKESGTGNTGWVAK